MDFFVKRVTGNQAPVVRSDLAIAFDIDRVGLCTVFVAARCYSCICTSDNFDRAFGQLTDNFLTFVSKAFTIFNLSNFRGVVRHLFSDDLICCFTSLLFIVELLAVDSLCTAIAQNTILDIGDGGAAFTAQRDFRLVGIIILHDILVKRTN